MNKSFLERVMFYIQRHTHTVQLRDFWASLIKLTLPRPVINQEIVGITTLKKEDAIIKELRVEGFSELGCALSDPEISSIMIRLKSLNCFDTGKPDKPRVNLDDPDINAQLAHYKRDDLVKIPEILAIANDSKILNVVSRYFGAKPTISNVNCWWSFSNRESAKEAQFFHRDLDDYKFLKMFIYLTDVNLENGPHIFVKKSHLSNKLNQLRRFEDAEVLNAFDSGEILTLTSPKGHCFIEDTYGIHKGQLPLKGKRLLLQIQYSYLPLHVEEYQPQHIANNSLVVDTYTNRLLIN